MFGFSVRRVALAAVIVLAAFAVAAPLLHSSPQQRPGQPTEGSMPVEVTNRPTVMAAQSGEWQVAFTRGATVQLEAPSFVQPKRSYRIRWGGGEAASYTIIQITGSWAEANGPSGRCWINLAMASEIADGR